ncbi:MAG: Crp/Fnr family transcriptional regulator [Pedobacter sp.]|uniref:Crp/Fnr family transcriptional regulator n=1 Tax=Pedobacter sp. TaxID=1411316 RepID=UPI003396FF71
MVTEDLLIAYGAKKVCFSKGEIIFNQGDSSRYFYQIINGGVKMNNFNDDGKEFVQGIFSDGDSFGEPPMLIKECYPANAVAIAASEIYLLRKERFVELLMANPEILFKLTTALAKRLYFKSIMASEISSQEPEHRVLKLIDYFKTKISKIPEDKPYRVEITRQQIADLTGLRVETVIRSIKSLEKKGELNISSRKVYR